RGTSTQISRTKRTSRRSLRSVCKNRPYRNTMQLLPVTTPAAWPSIRSKLRLYTACANKIMVISDPVAGKVLGTAAIGAGPDSIAFDDGYAFTPNGED